MVALRIEQKITREKTMLNFKTRDQPVRIQRNTYIIHNRTSEIVFDIV